MVGGKGIGLIAAAVITASAVTAKAGDGVGTYPNFTNYGVHGNPAVFHSSQYGEWGYLELGKSADGTENTDLMVSKNIGGDVTGSVGYSVSKNSSTSVLMLSMPVTKGVLAGGKLVTTTRGDGSQSYGSAVGAAGIMRVGEMLLRGGVFYSSPAVAWAAEARKKAAGCEFTISGKVVRSEGSVADKGLGFQAKKGNHMVSVGVGGKDWKDMKLHYRLFKGKTQIDLHVAGKGSNILKKPGYVGIGVTRGF